MRRSPRPDGTGRAVHPERAQLVASIAEDVVLDLDEDEDEEQQLQHQQQPSSGVTDGGCSANATNPKAAPRANPPPIAKPRSGRADTTAQVQEGGAV